MTDVHCPEGGRHEFGILSDRNLPDRAQCWKCGETIDTEIAERLLNAAMMLTADEAVSILKATNVYERVTDIPVLRAYARRWRGDTEGGK